LEVCYIGEWEGDTATAEFEKEIFKGWVLKERVALPNWANTAYELTVWKRRVNADTQPVEKALMCVGCGKRGLALKRCRYSREVCACSEACLLKAAKEYKANFALLTLTL